MTDIIRKHTSIIHVFVILIRKQIHHLALGHSLTLINKRPTTNKQTQIHINKRAQRALDRSPEEKVKGHSGVIYRGPLILYTKYQGSSRLSRFPYITLIRYASQAGPHFILGA